MMMCGTKGGRITHENKRKTTERVSDPFHRTAGLFRVKTNGN